MAKNDFMECVNLSEVRIITQSRLKRVLSKKHLNLNYSKRLKPFLNTVTHGMG